MSVTFSANFGSLLILKVLRRCGLRSAAAQIYLTCQGVTLAYFAINMMLQ